MRHGVLSAALMWLASCALHAQAPASWLAASVDQNLPADWSWSAAGQLRTAPGAVQWREGIVDLRVGQGLDAFPGWSVDGTWRTGWDWPAEGGWTTSWRWATSVKWKTDFGDHSLRLRMRHQFGGPWMRPWDRARWRLQAKWTHDLPDGWKVIPSVETFWGADPSLSSSPLALGAVRGRLAVDKKVAKRRHLTMGYQYQQGVHDHPNRPEHTVLLALDVGLKKVKKRKRDDGDP